MDTVADARSSAYQRPKERAFSMPLLGGGELAVVCPPWCVLGHEADREVGGVAEELVHTGAEVELKLPGVETVMLARIDHAPHSERPEPSVTLWPAGEDGPVTENLGPEDLAEMAEGMRATAGGCDQIRAELVRARTEWRQDAS